MIPYIWMLLYVYAPLYGIEPKLAAAVVKTESSFNHKARGSLGELGLFQIRPEFSKYSKEQLLNPRLNIIAGLEMLRTFKKKCKYQNNNLYVICHNSGIAGSFKIKKPLEFPYYKKVNNQYTAYKNSL